MGIKNKRQIALQIRLTLTEYDELRKNAGGKPLAAYVRALFCSANSRNVVQKLICKNEIQGKNDIQTIQSHEPPTIYKDEVIVRVPLYPKCCGRYMSEYEEGHICGVCGKKAN